MTLLSVGESGVKVVVASTKTQAADKEMFRCLGVEPTCQELTTDMLDEDTCRSEGFDVAEFCPAQEY